jgi:CRP/FNR family transcriptional regulator
MGARLLQVLGGCAQGSRVHVDLLLRRQADERVAIFLHDLLQRLRRPDSPPALTLPMSREDVGRYLGLALETVSRALTRLQEEGLIQVAGRTVRILDEPRLRGMASPADGEPGQGSPLEQQA